ncbi:acyl-CoA dehydrogenase [Pseudomonas sp. UL073]|uniref:Acyl-CoA dehydrogenase n=1 Tax=Zestomonas insulae TaxID=2809017 RepID=A0ABS2IF05_9GAMM|nr:acyl-CoA dehydrogenase family protein [Pseudomonas insulae]MBM7061677.1 acyl-CoA dehydrogenase [Pseudomonas insulae]
MPWQRLLDTHDRLPADASLDDWYAALRERLGGAPGPFELALLGGRLAASPGLAFLAGYQAALRALWPSAPASLGALCVTENKSVRPADLQTRLDGLTLHGRKDFVTAAEAADWLLVAARDEPAGAPPRVALCVVYNGAAGVRIETLPALPLMPDISHGRLHLDGAHCERLAGDGWDDYTKPFRSLEDLHVMTAVTAWQFGVAVEQPWPQALRLQLLGLLSGCAEVARQPASAAVSHVLLGGLFAQQAALRPQIDAAFASGAPELAAIWQRDQRLLDVASAARGKRLEKALASFA